VQYLSYHKHNFKLFIDQKIDHESARINHERQFLGFEPSGYSLLNLIQHLINRFSGVFWLNRMMGGRRLPGV